MKENIKTKHPKRKRADAAAAVESASKHASLRPYVRQFYKGNGGYLALVVLEIILSTGCNLLISRLIQLVLDLVAGEAVPFSLSALWGLAGLAVGLIVLSSACAYASRPRFVAKAMTQYKSYVFERLSQKRFSAFSGENTNLYISALSNDANVILSDYVGGLFTILEQMMLFVAALTFMLLVNPILTAVSVGLSLLPIVVSMLTGNRVAEAEKRVSDCNVSYMSTLRDSLSGFSVIKSFRAERQALRLFSEKVRQVAAEKEKSQKLTILVSMYASIAGVVVQLGVFLVGAGLALSGRAVTVGTVLIFVQLLNFVLQPISSVPTCLAKRKAAKALLQKLADAIDENVREEGEQVANRLREGISFQNVSFGYEDGGEVLHDVNVFFRAGKKYAIVGASGSGKSTLLNLLMASYGGYSGSICYDEHEIKNINSESLYDMVTMIQQNVFIFNASIRDNITMFKDFPEDEVRRAIELSGLSELLAERGADEPCGENGSGLSGGEKQRISIARSLLKRSQILLADEATAALDAETAEQVSDAILKLDGVTGIVVTHSLNEALLRRYDGIIALKNGTVAEMGSFEELLEKKGYFYSLFTVSQ